MIPIILGFEFLVLREILTFVYTLYFGTVVIVIVW